jgi:hypothetical protein
VFEVRIHTLLFGILVIFTPRASYLAQSFDAFAKSSGMVLCIGLRPELADSAAIVYGVSDEALGIDARETRVGYDSLGTPRFLSLLATTQTADSAYMKLYSLRFSQPHAGVYTIGSGPLSKPVNGVVPVLVKSQFRMVESVLTEPDVERARAFATEFWARRCQPFRIEM